MEEKKQVCQSIEEYITQFTPEISKRLIEIRAVINENAPEATEKISWGMPTFDLYGNLIHFAAFKNHIGIYPGDKAVDIFKDKLMDYKTSKGAIQLPNSKPVPLDLIKEIVEYRVKENIALLEEKGKKSKVNR